MDSDDKRSRTLLVRLIGVVVVAFVLILAGGVVPGYRTISRDADPPVAPDTLIGLGFQELPDTGKIELSLDVPPPNSQLSATLTITAKADELNALKKPPTLVVSGDVGNGLVGCTGADFKLDKSLPFEKLTPVSQAMVRSHWRSLLTKDDPDQSPPTEMAVVERATETQYAQVTFTSTEERQSTMQRIGDSGKSEEWTNYERWIEKECFFNISALWSSQGSDRVVELPRILTARPDNQYYVPMSISTRVNSDADHIVAQSTESFTTYGDAPSISEQSGQILAERQYKIKENPPSSYIYKSIRETQRDQKKVFLAGVWLGVLGGFGTLLLTWFYELKRLGRSSRSEG